MIRVWFAKLAKPIDTSMVQATAHVESVESGYTLDLILTTPSGSGQEQLRANECETFADVIALKIALMADPNALAPPPPVPTKRARSWALRVLASAGLATLPRAGPMLEVAAARRFGRVVLELGAGYGFAGTVRYGSLPDGVKIDAVLARPRLCGALDLAPIDVFVCGGMDLGLMRGRGVGPGLSEARSESQFYAALALGTQLRWPRAGRVAGVLSLELLPTIVRPGFTLRNLGRVYEAGRVGGRAGLGVEVRF
jgi:hypothetical protein